MHTGVGAIGSDQLGVPTMLNDPALLQHDDAIGPFDCRKPVGDDEHRPIPRDGLDRIEDAFFAAGVEVRCRFVEHQ